MGEATIRTADARGGTQQVGTQQVGTQQSLPRWGDRPTAGRRGSARPPAAAAFRPLIDALLGTPLPVAFRFWDGSGLGSADSPATIVVRSPDAIRRVLTAPSEVGFGRAFVAGDLDVEGDLFEVLALRDR